MGLILILVLSLAGCKENERSNTKTEVNNNISKLDTVDNLKDKRIGVLSA